MKQIYHFDQKSPPIINESMLLAELERRRLQRTTALLAVGSLLIMLCIILLAVQLYDTTPLLSIFCIAYVFFAAVSSGVIALIFTKKRRSIIKCL